MSTSRYRIVWLGLAAAIAAAALVAPSLATAKPLRVVPARPDRSADGTLSPAAHLALSQGYLVPDQRAYDRGKAKAATANPALAPALPPVFAKRAPSTVTSWQGLSDTDFAPSDSTGAVGTQRFIQLVNSQFGIYDKGATAPTASGSLNTLAGVSSADTLFDVQVIWDPTTSRFYYAMIDVTSQTQNALAYGYSKTASPSSGSSSDWCRYSIDFGNQFPDYPKLGDSKKFALIGVNIFQGGTIFTGAEALAISKPSNGSGCQSSPKIKSKSPLMSNSSTFAFTPVPANEIDTKGNGWIAAIPTTLPSKNISLFKVKNDNGTPKIQKTATQLKVGSYGAPANATQSGNSIRIDTLDGRLTQSVAAVDPSHNDKFTLWTQHAVSGGAGAKVRWYEIYPSDPKLIQKGSVSKSSKYVFDGAISPNRAVKGSEVSGGKNMVLNFVTSSSSSFPTIKIVSKKGGNNQSSPVTVKQSPGPIAGFDCDNSDGGGEPDKTSSQLCRWGDYASATPDPSNSQLIWNVSQWASGNKPACTTPLNCPATWRTQIFTASP